MKNGFHFEELNLMPLSALELTSIDGGDAAPYGHGADLGLAVARICDAAHTVGDFFSGLAAGLTGR